MKTPLSNSFAETFAKRFAQQEQYPILEFLELCKTDHMAYANAAERMLKAIGEPRIVDTSGDPRLSRIFSNRKVRFYDSFKDFYGAEEAIERMVAYFRHSAQGLEESKQILYLKGPVGGGKSSLVERLKDLMEKHPIYVLCDPEEKDPDLRVSPVFESPLVLFNKGEHGAALETEYGIHPRYLNTVPSGWAQEKLREFNGDFTRFAVLKIWPDKDRQIGIMKVEPSDENNQDVSVLVGKTDIRKLEGYPQNHPYAYSYSGGLNRTTQGLMDFAEMFKASIKTLNPLLMATQDHSYNGTENIPSLPHVGVIVAHSNEAEWAKFRNDKSNEAFLDRVYIVNVPYCLHVDEEIKIYEKMLRSSSLSAAPCAPLTLKCLAEFMVLTRLAQHENSTYAAKLRVYNGENVKDTQPLAKPYEEYREAAGVNEGMTGMSTRFGFKILSQAFNIRTDETQANPIDLMYVLTEALKHEQLPEATHEQYVEYIRDFIHHNYFDFVDKELRIAYLESYRDYGQTMFERYVDYAEAWLDESQIRDPDTHQLIDRDALNTRLEEIEKPAGIYNARDFRNEIVKYVLRYRANNGGNLPKWDSYEKIKVVIEKRMFSATQDIMPIVSFSPKGSSDDQKKHDDFIDRMKARGYTTTQIRILVDWWMNNRKAS